MGRSAEKMGEIMPKKEFMRPVNYILGSLVRWKGIVQQKCGHLFNSHLHVLVGRRNRLVGEIRRTCNMDQDEAARILDQEGEFGVSSFR
jgi:hypothetical protein